MSLVWLKTLPYFGNKLAHKITRNSFLEDSLPIIDPLINCAKDLKFLTF